MEAKTSTQICENGTTVGEAARCGAHKEVAETLSLRWLGRCVKTKCDGKQPTGRQCGGPGPRKPGPYDLKLEGGAQWAGPPGPDAGRLQRGHRRVFGLLPPQSPKR